MGAAFMAFVRRSCSEKYFHDSSVLPCHAWISSKFLLNLIYLLSSSSFVASWPFLGLSVS
jgi:hypothetical protein